MKKRVVVTGIGAISSLGNNTKEIWKNIIAGKSGISLIENIDTDKHKIKIASEVKNFNIDSEILSELEKNRYDKFIQFSAHSSFEALKDANLFKNNFDNYDSKKIGCILGVGMGGMIFMEKHKDVINESGTKRISPFAIPSIIPNMTSGLISILTGAKGTNYSVNSACASSNHAIISACLEILSGRHDVVITGGSEAVICDIPLAGFSKMQALSKNLEPQKASRPFDIKRDGFVIGEGAGILILEELSQAKKRGAKIYGEIAGWASNSDAYHITAPNPEGIGASECMKMAIEDANIKPTQIDYINAHGTSTPLGDVAETIAIKNTFKEHAYKLSISSTKSMIGHLLGAAGAIESIFCLLAIKDKIIPPTINLNEPDPKCDLDYTANKVAKKDIKYALNNAFGFGGTNSSIVIKKVNE